MTHHVTQRPAIVRTIAAVAAFLLVSVLVIRTSSAAFTSQTDNSGNAFATGTIDLTNDLTAPIFHPTNGSAIVDSAGMVPGDVLTGCIEVTYTGTIDDARLGEVRLSASAPTQDLATQLSVDARLDSSAACDTDYEQGFVDAGAANEVTWAASTGLTATGSGWTPSASNETRAYYVRVTFDAGAGDAYAGANATGLDLTWSVSTN